MKHELKPSSGKSPLSLRQQINEAAGQLDQRKRNVRSLASALAGRIRTGWASPRVLTAAGITGFVTAEWLHRPQPAPRPSSAARSRSTDRAQAAAMSKALLLMKLLIDLQTLWTKSLETRRAAQRQPASGNEES